MSFTGKVIKFEPLADNSLTVMLKVSGDQLQSVVDQFIKCRDGDEIKVDSIQFTIPEDRTSLLKDILFGVNAVKSRIEKELLQNETDDIKPKEQLKVYGTVTQEINADISA